jgi:type VI protein secretion system component VasK
MPDRPNDSSRQTAAYLLKGAAALFAVLGLSFIAWIGDKWIEFPEARASQFGFEAPLWPALGGFVLLAVVAVVMLFWRAAGRVKRGEDLFAQRHRRRSRGEAKASGGAER